MAYRKNNKKRQRGFTMIEVIAVLVIIAVLAAVAVSRISSTQDISAMTESEILKSHLRYVQMRSLSDIGTWGMSFNGSSYTALQDGNPATINLPNESSATHTLPTGITVSGSTVTFDKWGSPGTADITITISSGGGTITITQNTGFIP